MHTVDRNSRPTIERVPVAGPSAGSSACAWLRARTSTATSAIPAARASTILRTTAAASASRDDTRSSVGAMSMRSAEAAYAGQYAASLRAGSDTGGSTAAKTSFTHSTIRGCDRKLRASSTTPTGTLATAPRLCASRNNATSACLKR